ncbi:MAG: relaxase domain-containing protein [Acidimicrobiia bacterium]
MKFTVTPLGGRRADATRVIDSIVRYLQPRAKTPPTPTSGTPNASGPERYYADSGEEPGRWLGRTAMSMGLTGAVRREDFAAVLGGRDPHTNERLITAQGSAGRRPTLGAGAYTRVAADGGRLYGVADAAAALSLSRRDVEQMCDAGTAFALANLIATVEPAEGSPRGPLRPPAGLPHADQARPQQSRCTSRATSRRRSAEPVRPAGKLVPPPDRRPGRHQVGESQRVGTLCPRSGCGGRSQRDPCVG